MEKELKMQQSQRFDRSVFDDQSTADMTSNLTGMNSFFQKDNQKPLLEKGTEMPVVEIKSSPIQSYLNSAKLFFGNAYLTIPSVMMRTGVVGGIFIYLMVAFLNLVSMLMICKVAEKRSTPTAPIRSLSHLGENIFGKRGKIAVDSAIVVLQFSCLVMFLYTVST